MSSVRVSSVKKLVLIGLMGFQGFEASVAIANDEVQIRVPGIDDVILVSSQARALKFRTPDGENKRVFQDLDLAKKRRDEVAASLGCRTLRWQKTNPLRFDGFASVILGDATRVKIVAWEEVTGREREKWASQVTYAVPYFVKPRYQLSELFSGRQGAGAITSGVLGLGSAALTVYLGFDSNPWGGASGMGALGALSYPTHRYKLGSRSQQETDNFIENVRTKGFSALNRKWVIDEQIPDYASEPHIMFTKETYCVGSEEKLKEYDWVQVARADAAKAEAKADELAAGTAIQQPLQSIAEVEDSKLGIYIPFSRESNASETKMSADGIENAANADSKVPDVGHAELKLDASVDAKSALTNPLSLQNVASVVSGGIAGSNRSSGGHAEIRIDIDAAERTAFFSESPSDRDGAKPVANNGASSGPASPVSEALSDRSDSDSDSVVFHSPVQAPAQSPAASPAQLPAQQKPVGIFWKMLAQLRG